MPLLLGIDTGGTFTDAAVVDESSGLVVGWAKASTTLDDLLVGVDQALQGALAHAGAVDPDDIVLVSISTTLATNALVEGHGEPSALVTFGFSESELSRAGIEALCEPSLRLHLDGGHDAHGNERAPLDEAGLRAGLATLADRVSAVAVAAQFSVRNPAHELAAAELIRSQTGLPVTMSHELSAKLHGPRRALTALLNARLLGTIERLHRSVAAVLDDRGIVAPLMIVRGDGSLVSAGFAQHRPIETIMSGPAASVLGAMHLAGTSAGLVADMGGTTTDVAVITGGRPWVAADGATVGGHHTMVEALDMVTIGLGGDSEVRIDGRASVDGIVVGPDRALPICRLAVEHPGIHRALDLQLAAPTALESHGRFLVGVGAPDSLTGLTGLDQREEAVLRRLAGGPVPIEQAAPTGLEQRAARRLRARGLVRIATLTPTDAQVVLGTRLPGITVDTGATRKVASLLARKQIAGGRRAAAGPAELASAVVRRVVRDSAGFLLRTALVADGIDSTGAEAILDAALAGHRGAASVRIGVSSPLTAIGAPARAYYEEVAELLSANAVVPEYAAVANAVGAAVGRVVIRHRATITQPTRGQFRVHLADQPTFGSVDNARAAAAALLRESVTAAAEAAGAADPEFSETWEERTANLDDREVFVEGTLTVEAAGRPRS